MRAASGTSPFSAVSRQEQQAQWLLWQMHSVDVVKAGENSSMAAHQPAPQEVSLPTYGSFPRPRYDAVVQRMQSAKQKTGAYTAWNQESRTMQPASGSPKAEK